MPGSPESKVRGGIQPFLHCLPSLDCGKVSSPLCWRWDILPTPALPDFLTIPELSVPLLRDPQASKLPYYLPKSLAFPGPMKSLPTLGWVEYSRNGSLILSNLFSKLGLYFQWQTQKSWLFDCHLVVFVFVFDPFPEVNKLAKCRGRIEVIWNTRRKTEALVNIPKDYPTITELCSSLRRWGIFQYMRWVLKMDRCLSKEESERESNVQAKLYLYF